MSNHITSKPNNTLIYSPTPVKLNITPPTSPFGLFSRNNKNESPMISPFKVPHSFKSPNIKPYKKFMNTEDIEAENMNSSPKFANNFQDIFLDIKNFQNYGNEQEISNFQSPVSKFMPMNQWNDPSNNDRNNSNSNGVQIKKQHYCNCKKTKCLKLYCECFAIGEVCDSNCCCHDCSNLNNNSMRDNTIEQILTKDPQAFNAKIESSANKKINRRGCTCRKTNCLKKYCECYHAGIPCSDFCKCDHCKNNEFFIKENNAFKKLSIVTPLKEDENKSEDTIDTSYKKNSIFKANANGANSPETWLSEPRKQRKIVNKNNKQEESNGKIVIEKSLIF